MNTSLYKLGQCASTGFPHHTTLSPSGLQQVLHHYSMYVTRLSIMALQCGLILQDIALTEALKVCYCCIRFIKTYVYWNQVYVLYGLPLPHWSSSQQVWWDRIVYGCNYCPVPGRLDNLFWLYEGRSLHYLGSNTISDELFQSIELRVSRLKWTVDIKSASARTESETSTIKWQPSV